jgi:hypothetical protein
MGLAVMALAVMALAVMALAVMALAVMALAVACAPRRPLCPAAASGTANQLPDQEAP